MSTEKPNDLSEDLSPSSLPSTEERASMVDAGRSLSAEVRLLRDQVGDLCRAMRALVTLISVLDKKVDACLKSAGSSGPTCGVI